MSEAQMDLEVEEAQPNAPQWIFDGSIPQIERARLMDDTVASFKTVFDPEIPCDIYELGLIYKVEVTAEKLFKVDMTLTAPGCPVAGELARQVETAVSSVGGTLGVVVEVVFDPPWDQSRMSDEARVALDMF